MPVSFRELYNAFELLSMANPLGQYEAFLCRQTGKIYHRSDDSDFAELEEELPDDIEDSEKYIAIPDKRDLDLGKVLVLDFARECLSDDYKEVERISARGAPTRNSRPCSFASMRLMPGTHSKVRRPKGRSATGVSSIR